MGGGGVESDELIDADWLQIELAALGANVFYFLSAPMRRLMMEVEPLDLEVLRERRIKLVEFLGQAIFKDRKLGAELAAKVLADSPMPEISEIKGFEVKPK